MLKMHLTLDIAHDAVFINWIFVLFRFFILCQMKKCKHLESICSGVCVWSTTPKYTIGSEYPWWSWHFMSQQHINHCCCYCVTVVLNKQKTSCRFITLTMFWFLNRWNLTIFLLFLFLFRTTTFAVIHTFFSSFDESVIISRRLCLNSSLNHKTCIRFNCVFFHINFQSIFIEDRDVLSSLVAWPWKWDSHCWQIIVEYQQSSLLIT